MSATEADREKARELTAITGVDNHEDAIEAVAEALAAEREKARAPFLELADRWEAMAASVEGTWDAVTIRSHVDHIRRAAEDGQ